MAAITSAVVVGAGTLLTIYGQQEQKKAGLRAASINADEAELNAKLTAEQTAEDVRVMRLNFRKDQGRNVAAVGASGIKMEGSPLEVLQENAATAERDFQNVQAGGEQRRSSYLRQAKNFREGGSADARAADVMGAATLLKGAGETYSAGSKSGAWK